MRDVMVGASKREQTLWIVACIAAVPGSALVGNVFIAAGFHMLIAWAAAMLLCPVAWCLGFWLRFARPQRKKGRALRALQEEIFRDLDAMTADLAAVEADAALREAESDFLVYEWTRVARTLRKAMAELANKADHGFIDHDLWRETTELAKRTDAAGVDAQFATIAHATELEDVKTGIRSRMESIMRKFAQAKEIMGEVDPAAVDGRP